jgi:hypothetical protein
MQGAGGGGQEEAPRGVGSASAQQRVHEQAKVHGPVDGVIPPAHLAGVYTVRLPGLKVVSPNRVRGVTRGAALSEAARHRRLVEIGMRHTQGSLGHGSLGSLVAGTARVNVTIVRVAPKFFDDDNYVSACKWLRDGVAKGFGVPDNHRLINFYYEQAHGKPKEYEMRIEYRFARV